MARFKVAPIKNQKTMNTKKLAPVLWLLFVLTGVRAQTLTYQLLPDSSVTPVLADGSAGVAQPLRGFFSMLINVPTEYTDSDSFLLTSLHFTSASYSFKLAGTLGGSIATQIGPDGQTEFAAWATSPGLQQSSDFIGSYANGSFDGDATAPTELYFEGVGLAPLGEGAWTARMVIHAELTPTRVTLESVLVTASPPRGGTAGGGGTFAAGSSHTVQATANRGFAFASWTENGIFVSSATSYTFTLIENRNLVANFARK